MTDYRELLKLKRAGQLAPRPLTSTAEAMKVRSHEVRHVTQSDIARRHGVTRQAVAQWLALPGWPTPLIDVGRTRLWDAAEVDAWVSVRRGRRSES